MNALDNMDFHIARLQNDLRDAKKETARRAHAAQEDANRKALLGVIKNNVDNTDMTDADFRQFIRNSVNRR